MVSIIVKHTLSGSEQRIPDQNCAVFKQALQESYECGLHQGTLYLLAMICFDREDGALLLVIVASLCLFLSYQCHANDG